MFAWHQSSNKRITKALFKKKQNNKKAQQFVNFKYPHCKYLNENRAFIPGHCDQAFWGENLINRGCFPKGIRARGSKLSVSVKGGIALVVDWKTGGYHSNIWWA